MTHQEQINLRQKRIDSIQSELKRKKNAKIESLRVKIEDVKEVERKLLERSKRSEVKDLTHEDFNT